MFTTPSAALQLEHPDAIEPLASRVEPVVSIATPHYGAPIAAHLSSVMGAKVMRLLAFAIIYTMEFGKVPLSALVAGGKLVTQLDDLVGLEDSVLDELYEKLLDDFNQDDANKIKRYLASIGSDNAALEQLTPGGIDLLNAATGDRPGVRYGSVAMKTDRPGWATIKAIGFDPHRQATHLIYRVLHHFSGSTRVSYPAPTPQQERRLIDAYGGVPDGTESDGFVPTHSQIWGDLLYAGTVTTSTSWVTSTILSTIRRTTIGSRPEPASTARSLRRYGAPSPTSS